jgi:chromate transporter
MMESTDAGNDRSAGASRVGNLRELARLFLKLGVIGFGGPAAHIAMMEDEVVRRRGWLTHKRFLDLLGATNLIPGPNSTEMAIHIGHVRAGFPGLLVAGTCFILPAMLIVMGCAWAYTRFGALPEAKGVLYGVKPVIIAVVVQALWGLTRAAVKTGWLAALGAAVVGFSFAGANELLLLFAAGFVVAIVRALLGEKRGKSASLLAATPLPAPMLETTNGLSPATTTTVAGLTTAAAVTPFGLWPLFWFFLKVGSVLYGSGYVLLAFLRADLVERWGWLSETQLLDAVAVGQITPGPVFTTATFIGYVLAGTPGALVATVGIFLPAFFFVAISGPLIPRLRASPIAGAFLDGVNVASLALMAVVTWQLGRVALVDGLTMVLAALSALLLLRFRLNSAWLVTGGAVAGVTRSLFW